MIAISFLAAAAATNLDAIDQAVARCDRAAANPAFAGEAARRSQFLLGAFREQEAIVAARVDLTQRRKTWREAARPLTSDDRAMKLEEAALDDRQKTLNDQRMLEALRRDTMDSMRQYFLLNCPSGGSK